MGITLIGLSFVLLKMINPDSLLKKTGANYSFKCLIQDNIEMPCNEDENLLWTF